MTDNSGSRESRPSGSALSRRRLLAATGLGLTGSVAGLLGATETAAAAASDSGHPLEESPGSHFAPNDGFAQIDWFDDDVDVHRVQEATRSELESALTASGPRLVVFETSGTIDLGAERLAITNDKCWVAGQTAPSPGITLTRGEFQIDADDCVVQHVRVRPGDAGQSEGWEPDSITTADGTANNVFDHVSASWSVDEVASPGYDTTDTTLANCIVAEALNDATHHKGPHCYGSLVGDGATGVAVLGTLYAQNEARTPRLKAGTKSAVVNNVMYNYDEATNLDDSTEASIEGNAYFTGDPGDGNIGGGGEAYIHDNYSNPDTHMVEDAVTQLDARPVWPGDLRALPARATDTHAYTHAGARPADRTEHDERAIRQTREQSGGYIDSQDDVGGYPDLAENTRELDVPDTGKAEWLFEFTKEVEVGVHTYADDEGTVTDGHLRQALADWENDAIDTPLLRRVIAAW